MSIRDKNELLVSEIPEYMANRLKVKTNYNPYLAKDQVTQAAIKTVEDIQVYHKKIRSIRLLGDILKDKSIKKRTRKRVAKDVYRLWHKEFKSEFKEERNFHIDHIKKVKRKKITYVHQITINTLGATTLLLLLISHRFSLLTHIPILGRFFRDFYRAMERPLWNNAIVGLVYLSLFTTLYYIVLKTYYNILRDVGGNAEGYIIKMFKRILNKYRVQHRILKKHLKKFAGSRFYKQPYRIKKIYDPKIVLSKLEDYRQYIDEKMNHYKRYDILLRISGYLLKFFIVLSIAYIGWAYFSN